MSRLILICVSAFSLAIAGCSASTGGETDVGVDRGTGTSDCDFCVPNAEICVNRTCQPAPCSVGSCPIGYVCSGGVCQSDAGPECAVDEECPSGRCVEGSCYTLECELGETRDCFSECGGGTEICAGGVFGECDAPRPAEEICGDQIDQDCDRVADEGCDDCDPASAPEEICGDDFDNDCDELVDEGCPDCQPGDREPCDSECGEGFRSCEDGVFGECGAPLPTEEVCDGADNDCDGSTDEELSRECETACGLGLEACEAGEWVECDAPTVCDCDDGDTDTQPCGLCGERERTCVGSTWQPWGDCSGEGVCEPDELEYQDCGHGTLGICELGTQQRTCRTTCEWSEWSACAGAVDPVTEVCGDGIDQDCDGEDLVIDDFFEPNDTCGTAYDLGFEPDGEVVRAYISSADDGDDFYSFEAEDGFSITTLERIVVTLEDIPRDANYDLFLYPNLEACTDNAHLDSSELPSRMDESIEWTESRGVEDGGIWYVRVSRFDGSSCEGEYQLTVTGLR